MTSISALNYIHKTGLFGNFENKKEENLLKISENKNLLIVQIVRYKNSSISIEDLNIDGLKLRNEALNVISNENTRILWNGPNNWILISINKNLLQNILKVFKDSDFAITDLSHSRAVIELEGHNVKEVLKKGCPYNFNILNKNQSINSVYNGIAFTVDMLDDNPNKIRLLSLRSFGESFYESLTDASLEFGFKGI
jgi:sarcosine oxidase subunit gamma